MRHKRGDPLLKTFIEGYKQIKDLLCRKSVVSE